MTSTKKLSSQGDMCRYIRSHGRPCELHHIAYAVKALELVPEMVAGGIRLYDRDVIAKVERN